MHPTTKLWIRVCGFLCLNLCLMADMVFAQSSRYPTTAEVERVRVQTRKQIQSLTQGSMSYLIHDRRSLSEKQQIASFVNTWSKTAPAVAPFLGEWRGSEVIVHVYPSLSKQKVCIITTSIGYSNFTTASVVGGNLHTQDRRVLFREGAYMGIAAVVNNQAIHYGSDTPLKPPYPLKSPRQIKSISTRTHSGNLPNWVYQQFETEGCTVSLK